MGVCSEVGPVPVAENLIMLENDDGGSIRLSRYLLFLQDECVSRLCDLLYCHEFDVRLHVWCWRLPSTDG